MAIIGKWVDCGVASGRVVLAAFDDFFVCVRQVCRVGFYRFANTVANKARSILCKSQLIKKTCQKSRFRVYHTATGAIMRSCD